MNKLILFSLIGLLCCNSPQTDQPGSKSSVEYRVKLPKGIKEHPSYSVIEGEHEESTGSLDIRVESGYMNLPDSVRRKLKLYNNYYSEQGLRYLKVIGEWPYTTEEGEQLSDSLLFELYDHRFSLHGQLVDVEKSGIPVFRCDTLKIIGRRKKRG